MVTHCYTTLFRSHVTVSAVQNGKHDVQTVQHAGEQIGGFIRTHHDGGRTDAQGEEEGKSDMRGLWKGDGGGVT